MLAVIVESLWPTHYQKPNNHDNMEVVFKPEITRSNLFRHSWHKEARAIDTYSRPYVSPRTSTGNVEGSSNATTKQNKHCYRRVHVTPSIDKPYRSAHWYCAKVIGHAHHRPHATSVSTMMATRTSR